VHHTSARWGLQGDSTRRQHCITVSWLVSPGLCLTPMKEKEPKAPSCVVRGADSSSCTDTASRRVACGSGLQHTHSRGSRRGWQVLGVQEAAAGRSGYHGCTSVYHHASYRATQTHLNLCNRQQLRHRAYSSQKAGKPGSCCDPLHIPLPLSTHLKPSSSTVSRRTFSMVVAFSPLCPLSNASCCHATSRALPDSDSTTSKAMASLSAASSGSRHSIACQGGVQQQATGMWQLDRLQGKQHAATDSTLGCPAAAGVTDGC
jgi:hypothetical protein